MESETATTTKPSRRADILAAATRLFAQHGYQAVGVDRIIAESGVAKMTLYNHFPAKSDLVKAVLEDRHAAIENALRTEVERRRTTATRIKSIFDWYDRWMQDDDFSGCMFMHASGEYGNGDAPILAAVAEQKAALTGLFRGILTQDECTASNADRLATVFVLLLDGAIVTREAMGDRSAAAKAWMAAKVMLDAQLASRPA